MKKILLVLSILSLFLPAALAEGVPEESNSMVVEDTGLIFDTQMSEYSETAEWTKSGFGFMEHDLKITSAAGAQAAWKGVRPGDNGYYRVYIWKNALENGDKNVQIEWFATGSSSGKAVMDCSIGESGWQYLGVCNTSDLTFDMSVTASGTGVAAVSCFRLVKTTKDEFLSYIKGNARELIIKIGSGSALLGDSKIDMTMGRAVIKDSRTMLPLRFVMENMGAEVTWEESEKKICITYGETAAVFYVGKTEYSVNNETKTLDSPPYIESNRTMLPIRAFAEAIGKSVYWDERGVAVIAEKDFSAYEDAVKKGLEL